MNSVSISDLIKKLFEQHRIVFWYDEKVEFYSEYENLKLSGVEKIKVENNEFGVKYRVLREEPKQKFLLYFEKEEPENIKNWLFDVQLANVVFKADLVSMWMTEIGIPLEYKEIVAEHETFFKIETRREALRNRINKNDSMAIIRRKMIAICLNAGTEHRIDSILESLFSEYANQKEEKFELIKRCNLGKFLWEEIKKSYGYHSENPSIKDFLIVLFETIFNYKTDQRAKLNRDSISFVEHWKDSRKHHKGFVKLSDEIANEINIEENIKKFDYKDLVDIDYFKVIDLFILKELAQDILQKTISFSDIEAIIRKRKTTYWYSQLESFYETVSWAGKFIYDLENITLDVQSLEDGVLKYVSTWHKIDQSYRKFIYYYQVSNRPVFETLYKRIENLYSNQFLLELNNIWQKFIDEEPSWNLRKSIVSQNNFFSVFIDPFIQNKTKVAVIISDAFRYEIGEELNHRIDNQDKYTSKISPMISSVPSYTQLGMASLLPNEQIEVISGGYSVVDGVRSEGTENRKKILSGIKEINSIAIRAEDYSSQNSQELKKLTKENDLIYIYQNQIDNTGDKQATERNTFKAVEDTLDELEMLIRKITSANITNILIASDHGFIYQDNVDDSDYLSTSIDFDDLFYRNRRFVIAKSIQKTSSIKIFDADQIGLKGDFQVAFAKSINRLRLQGSGSRFVHGGLSLQEIMIPVLQINKKKQSNMGVVEVDVIASKSNRITTGQLTVRFFQKQPISNTLRPLTIMAGLYSEDGEKISNIHEIIFDSTSEEAREREVKIQLFLNKKAEDYNNQPVKLKLKSNIENTNQYTDYLELPYTLNRSLLTDFEF